MNTITRPVSFNDLTVPYVRAFFGSTLVTLSLYATISFMSQGFSGLAFLSVVVFCVAIEVVKILSAGDIGFYLALHSAEKAILSSVIVVILVVLSIGAETWFLVSGSLKEATLIEQTSDQTSALQTRIAGKQVQLAACNPTSLTKCVNPRTVELEALQTELATVTAASSSSVAQTEAEANAKFWTQVSTATGTTPENLILGLNIIRAILQELLGVYYLGQFSTWRRLKALSLEEDSNLDPYLVRKSRDGSPRDPDRQEPKYQGNVTPTPVARPTVQLPPAAPVSTPAPTVRAPIARSPKAASFWTPKEKEQMYLAHFESLVEKKAALRKTSGADMDKGTSIFDSLSDKPKVKASASALDMTKLTPKQ